MCMISISKVMGYSPVLMSLNSFLRLVPITILPQSSFQCPFKQPFSGCYPKVQPFFSNLLIDLEQVILRIVSASSIIRLISVSALLAENSFFILFLFSDQNSSSSSPRSRPSSGPSQSSQNFLMIRFLKALSTVSFGEMILPSTSLLGSVKVHASYSLANQFDGFCFEVYKLDD